MSMARMHIRFVKYLKNELKGFPGSEIKWNFGKFMLDRNGKPYKRFSRLQNQKLHAKTLKSYWQNKKSNIATEQHKPFCFVYCYLFKLKQINGYEQLKLEKPTLLSVYAVSRLIIRAYQEDLDRLGITYPQYLVLMVLWEKMAFR